MVLFQGPVLARLANRFSEATLILVGALLLAAGFALFLQSSLWIIGLGVILFAAGNGIMWPSFLSVLSSAAGETYQGAVQGLASSVGSLASIIGLIVGGILYSSLQNTTFLIPAILMCLIFIGSIRLFSIKASSADSKEA